jgi:hypothetical protein
MIGYHAFPTFSTEGVGNGRARVYRYDFACITIALRAPLQ